MVETVGLVRPHGGGKRSNGGALRYFDYTTRLYDKGDANVLQSKTKEYKTPSFCFATFSQSPEW